MRYFKLETFVPPEYVEKVKSALAEAGAGRYGDYDRCFWSVPGTGEFRPLAGSHPFRGREGEVCRTPEIKLETLVAEPALPAVKAALKASHPYETPVCYVTVLAEF